MTQRDVKYHVGISDADRVTVFVPPFEFESHEIGATYPVDLLLTKTNLILFVQSPDGFTCATNLNLVYDLAEGKELWISHLHPTLGYIQDQAKLNIRNIRQVVEEPQA